MARGLTATFVVLALGAAACSAGSDGGQADSGDQQPTPTSVSPVTTPVTSAASDDSTPAGEDRPGASSGEVERALTDAGVAVRDTSDDTLGTASGFELTSFQVASMDRQLTTGHGIVGTALDDMFGAPGGLPFSFLIAAWVSTAPTPIATQAATLMGEQPWEQAPNVVFPTAVLMLFAVDAVNAANSASAQGFAASLPTDPVVLAGMRSSPEGTGVCSELAAWFGSILDFLFDSLKADTDGLFGFLAEIWNAAIDLARSTIGGVIEVLTAPVVAIVAEVIGVIGTMSMVVALLVPWTVELTETDARPPFAVGAEPDIAQRFTASVDTNVDVEWPAEVEDCASVAGFDLPDPGEAVGSPVDWLVVGLPPNGTETASEPNLDDDNQAVFDWITGREESSDGDEVVGVVSATATVTSTQIDELRSMLQSLIAGFVPVAPFGEIVGELFVDLAGPVFDQFAELVQVSGSTSVRVTHHDDPEPETTVPITTTGPEVFDVSTIDPCTIISPDEAALAMRGTPAKTQSVGESVSFAGFGAIGCRYFAQLTPRLEQYLSVSISPDGDGRLDTAASWNPWGYWDVLPFADVGDDARINVSNGSSEFGSPAGTIYRVVAARDGVLVGVSVSHSWPETADGLAAIAELALERAISG